MTSPALEEHPITKRSARQGRQHKAPGAGVAAGSRCIRGRAQGPFSLEATILGGGSLLGHDLDIVTVAQHPHFWVRREKLQG